MLRKRSPVLATDEDALLVEQSHTQAEMESVLIRGDELDENIQTSLLVLSQLKVDMLERQQRLETLQLEHKDNVVMASRLSQIYDKARLIEAICDRQLQDFDVEVAASKVTQTAQTHLFKGIIHERLTAVSSARKRLERAKKMKQQRVRSLRKKISSASVAKETNRKGSFLHDRILRLRADFYEKGFLRLREASGTDDVEEMIAKLIYVHETGKLLADAKSDAVAKVYALQDIKLGLEAKLALTTKGRDPLFWKVIAGKRTDLMGVQSEYTHKTRQLRDHSRSMANIRTALEHHLRHANQDGPLVISATAIQGAVDDTTTAVDNLSEVDMLNQLENLLVQLMMELQGHSPTRLSSPRVSFIEGAEVQAQPAEDEPSSQLPQLPEIRQQELMEDPAYQVCTANRTADPNDSTTQLCRQMHSAAYVSAP
jgi:hypothetical protein